MDALDPVLLARLQFAFTISFHIIFPSFTIGLASYLAVLEGLWLRTGDDTYQRLYRFWVRPFAVTFAMGVVSGIVLSYQFGTNWSRFSDAAGPVLGPLMAYEVLTAFFLEAGFLGIMLFGWEKVGRGLHYFATCMVALGTLISAFWILSANSWMQTPTGFELVDGRYLPLDWWQIVFNPSFPYRLVHMVLAAYLTTAFVVGATGAFHLLRDRLDPGARRMFSMAMWMAALVAPIQLVAGDAHGLNTLQYQPAKIAALEGHFDTETGAPLILFGWPDMQAAETRYKIEIPHLGSVVLTHEWNGRLQGLKDFPRDQWPYSPLIFWTFRIMVGLGLLMMGIGLLSLWLRWTGQLFETAWFHRVCVATGPIGFIAILAGWITTEVGRQPWVVYGLMRTADAASPVPAASVATTLALFVLVYCSVFGVGFVYLLRLMAQRPGDPALRPPPPPEEGGKRPLSVPGIAIDPAE
jgi:cytochrome d ubiquinol oxidase subunit I